MTCQPPISSVTGLSLSLSRSDWNFAWSSGCVAPRKTLFWRSAPFSANWSVSGPRAGFTYCSKSTPGPAIPDRILSPSGNFFSRVFSVAHCGESKVVSRRTSSGAVFGTIAAPPSPLVVAELPLLPPPPPPQAASGSASSAASRKSRRRRRTAVILLTPRAAAHQGGDEIAEAVAFEDAADALGDRQLDPEPVREIAEDRRGRQPLDHLTDPRDRLVRGRALRDQLAGVAVPPVRAVAGDDQVAHAGQAGERLGTGAVGLPQARHLGEAPGDQGRLAVVAEAEPVDAAGRERDHVLRGRAELDAGEISVDVDAEDRRIDRVLELDGELLVVARDHCRARQALGDLLGHVRPGEHGDRAVADQRREPLTGRGVEALRQREHRASGRQRRNHLGECAARDRQDVDVGAGRRL